MHGTTMKI